MASASSSYVCDTLPAARLATAAPPDDHLQDPPDMPVSFEPTPPVVPDNLDSPPPSPRSDHPEPTAQQPPPRKLCVRHQRMADEGTNLKLQQSLDALPFQEREQVNAIWSAFSSSSHPRRALILQGLLTMCCFSQLSLLTEHLAHLIRIDPFVVLPHEVILKILKYLDATSLCRAAQVSRHWKALADDDILWRGICEQHIGQKCAKCGWGLPILEKKMRVVRLPSSTPCPSPSLPMQQPPLPSPPSAAIPLVPSLSSPLSPATALKRTSDDSMDLSTPALKRQKSEDVVPANSACSLIASFSSLLSPSTLAGTVSQSATRPWKDVYCERMTVERNWRRGRCTVRTLKGHTDGIMCLQFLETLSHPAFPVLITGSYDRTVRVWNMETGVELHCLKGHTRAVRALQFDEVKLITGSMDSTIKVWDWRRGRCIRTLTGHTEGVVCLNFDSNVLASGSVDATIKVWNLRTGGAFTLRGHSDWVNSVQLWDSNLARGTNAESSSPWDGSTTTVSNQQCALQIDPGKMLFSASDDGTIRLWDLTHRTCIKQFTGHVGQVQSMRLVDQCGSGEGEEEADEGVDEKMNMDADPGVLLRSCIAPSSSMPSPIDSTPKLGSRIGSDREAGKKKKRPMLISGSLDNTIKMWDIETGKTVRTFFGHIEGVWAVAGDKLRLVSGSHDRTVKVWSREEGKCTATLVGHQAAVSCLALGEDKIVSGSDDNDIKIWSFGG